MSRSLTCVALALALALPLSTQEQAGPDLGASIAARPLPFAGAPASAVVERSWESLFPGLPRPDWVGARAAELGDVPEVVHAPNARFEATEPLALPGLLTKPLTLDGVFQSGWFLLSMDRSPQAADRSFLDQEVGAVRDADGQALARWYLPNRTLAVFLADGDAHARLAAWEHTLGLRRYEPAFKLSPHIGSLELSSLERLNDPWLHLHVDLVPGHPAELVLAQLAGLDVELLREVRLPSDTLHEVHFLAVRAAPAALVGLAWIEGVRFVSEAGDGVQLHDLSMAGKLQAGTLAVDNLDQSSPQSILDSEAEHFPLWLEHDLQGQGQLIGVVDTQVDYDNSRHALSDCTKDEGSTNLPDDEIQNYGFADPVDPKIPDFGPSGVSPKIPLVDIIDGAAITSTTGEGSSSNCNSGDNDAVHGSQVAASAAADFYGSNADKYWEHDPDAFLGCALDRSGVMGPGLAHEAQLYFTPVFDADQLFAWNIAGQFETNMGTTLNNMSAADCSATVHSTGIIEANNAYSQLSFVHDQRGFQNQMSLQVMAAGNEGDSANALTSQAVVKNALTVGASEDVLKPEDRAAFSSVGPRFDGARKPDILAPGCDTFVRNPPFPGSFSLLVLPTSNGTALQESCMVTFSCGTSFSAPLAAGAVALVHQWFEEGNSPGVADPTAALLKAMMIHGSQRLTGAGLTAGAPYPSTHQGWGEPELDDLLFPVGARSLFLHDAPDAELSSFTSANQGGWFVPIDVTNGAEPLSVTLVWTDEPGSVGGGKQLINDLDLIVRSPGFSSVFRGNVFDTSSGSSVAGGARDTLNNVERVLIPMPELGQWVIGVEPTQGSFSTPQGYALVVSGAVTEGSALQPGVLAVSTNPGFSPAPLVQAKEDGSLDELVFAGFAATADPSEDVILSALALSVNDVGASAFGPLQLYRDDDQDGVSDSAALLGTTTLVAGVASFTGLGLSIAAGTGQGLVASIGSVPPPGSSGGPGGLLGLTGGALLTLYALGLLARRSWLRRVLYVRPRLRALAAGAALVFFVGGSGLAALSCGGGGSGEPTFIFTLDPASFVLQGQTTGEVHAASGAVQTFQLRVAAPAAP